jgi:hypothetical protein
MRLPALLLLVPLLCGLTACNEPRVPATSRSDSLTNRTPLAVEVVKVWNQATNRVEGDNDPHVSHYIEVDVVDGPQAGTKLTLPYDAWNVGKEPPERGTRLVIAPADWVQRNNASTGRPFGAW